MIPNFFLIDFKNFKIIIENKNLRRKGKFSDNNIVKFLWSCKIFLILLTLVWEIYQLLSYTCSLPKHVHFTLFLSRVLLFQGSKDFSTHVRITKKLKTPLWTKKKLLQFVFVRVVWKYSEMSSQRYNFNSHRRHCEHARWDFNTWFIQRCFSRTMLYLLLLCAHFNLLLMFLLISRDFLMKIYTLCQIIFLLKILRLFKFNQHRNVEFTLINFFLLNFPKYFSSVFYIQSHFMNV